MRSLKLKLFTLNIIKRLYANQPKISKTSYLEKIVSTQLKNDKNSLAIVSLSNDIYVNLALEIRKPLIFLYCYSLLLTQINICIYV